MKEFEEALRCAGDGTPAYNTVMADLLRCGSFQGRSRDRSAKPPRATATQPSSQLLQYYSVQEGSKKGSGGKRRDE
jgi:hypothetical protein